MRVGKLENGGLPLIRIDSPAAGASIVKGPTRFTLPYNALPTVLSGVSGHHDVLSPSQASLAAPFLPVGNCRREL